MSVELASILVLGAIFLVATVYPIHRGALAISAAFVVGMFVLPGTSGAKVASIVRGFPGRACATGHLADSGRARLA